MAKEFTAQFYDGKTTNVYNVIVKIVGEELILEDLTRWPLTSLQLNGRALTSSKQPEARLLIADDALYAEILSVIPSKNIQASGVQHSWKILILIGLLSLALFIGAFWGIPQAAPFVAKLIPHSWDDRIGKSVIFDIVEDLPQCTAPEGVAALNKLKTRLVGDQDFDIRVIKFNNNEPNAFAVPGNHLVIMNGLLEFADNPDEVAGVLAHEIGHAISHHPTAGIIRLMGFQTLMVGAFGSSFDFATNVLNLKYTRDNEGEADDIAIKMLTQAHIDNRSFAEFFKKLEDLAGESPKGLMQYLASHPELQSRIEKVLQQPSQANVTPALTPQEWRALKNICKETTPLDFEKK